MPQAIELPDDLTGLAAIQAHTVDDRGLRRSVSALIEVIEAGRNSLTAATVAETSPACNPNGGTIRTNPIDGMNYVYIPPGLGSIEPGHGSAMGVRCACRDDLSPLPLLGRNRLAQG